MIQILIAYMTLDFQREKLCIKNTCRTKLYLKFYESLCYFLYLCTFVFTFLKLKLHNVYVLSDNSGQGTCRKQEDSTKQEGDVSSRKQEDVTKSEKEKLVEPEDNRGDSPESGVSTIVITSPPSKQKQYFIYVEIYVG